MIGNYFMVSSQNLPRGNEENKVTTVCLGTKNRTWELNNSEHWLRS